MGISISRPYAGITLNTEREYLNDDSGNLMIFVDVDEAKNFLKIKGYEEDDLYFFDFEEE